MPDRYVVDTGVITLYFAGDSVAKRYVDEILNHQKLAFISELNLAEFSYIYARTFGWEGAATKVRLIRNQPFRIEGVDEDLTTSAAKFKSKYSKYSLADCYLLALALRLDATLLTTDGPLSKNREVPAILIPVPKS